MALKPKKISKEVALELSKKLDKKLIKKLKKSSSTTLSYISGATCTDILNKTFGHNWSTKIVDRWTEPGYDQIRKEDKNGKFKIIDDKYRPEQIFFDGYQKCVRIPQLPTAWCLLELSVVLEDENGKPYTITKSAFGSSSFNGNQDTQSTNGFKGAQTDALKKAASLFGIGLELYRKDEGEREYYDDMMNDLLIVWTNDMKAKYPDCWKYIDSVCEENDWDYNDLSYYVETLTDGEYSNILQLPEKYINQFVDYLSKDLETEEGDDE